MILNSLLSFALLCTTLIVPGKSDFPCSLEWKSVLVNTPIGENWVRIDSGNEAKSSSNIITRIKNSNFDVYDINNGKDFFLAPMQPSFHETRKVQVANKISEETVTNYFSTGELTNLKKSKSLYLYEVLTNPHQCKLTWEACIFKEDPLSMGSRKFKRVSSSNVTSNEYIARIRSDPGNSFLYNVFGLSQSDQDLYFGEKMSCLQATTTPTITVTQFEFDYSQADDGTEDIMGFDQINNLAETNVVQTVTHRKIMAEKHQFATSKSETWTYMHTWRGFFCCIFFFTWAWIDVGYRTYSESSSRIVFQSEKEILSTRIMNVPAGASIQACSTLNFNDKYILDYKAEGRHLLAPGMSMADLETKVREAGYTTYTIEGDSIVVPMAGTFEGKMAFRSTFFVSDSQGEATCATMKRKFEQRNVLKERLALKFSNETIASLKKIEQEIQDIKRKLTVMPQH